MKLVVGLGNPGPRYARTRHNVGVRVVEALAERLRVPFADGGPGRLARASWDDLEVALLVPSGFMNTSGGPVADAVAQLPVADPGRDLLVVLDDLDLPLGRLRLRPHGGDGGHRGLRDVIAQLERETLPRLRFGVGRPPPGVDPVAHVLAPFTADEELPLRQALARAVDAVICFLEEDIEVAMSRTNAPAA